MNKKFVLMILDALDAFAEKVLGKEAANLGVPTKPRMQVEAERAADKAQAVKEAADKAKNVTPPKGASKDEIIQATKELNEIVKKQASGASAAYKAAQSAYDKLIAQPEYKALVPYIGQFKARRGMSAQSKAMLTELEKAKASVDKLSKGTRAALDNEKMVKEGGPMTQKDAMKKASTTPPVKSKYPQRLMSSGDPDKNLLAKIEMPADKIKEATKVVKGKIDKSGGNVYSNMFGLPDPAQIKKMVKTVSDKIVIARAKFDLMKPKNQEALRKFIELNKQDNQTVKMIDPKSRPMKDLARWVKVADEEEIIPMFVDKDDDYFILTHALIQSEPDKPIKFAEIEIPKYFSPLDSDYNRQLLRQLEDRVAINNEAAKKFTRWAGEFYGYGDEMGAKILLKRADMYSAQKDAIEYLKEVLVRFINASVDVGGGGIYIPQQIQEKFFDMKRMK